MPAYTNDSRDGGGRRQLVVALVIFLAAVSTAFLPAPRQQQVASWVRGTVLRPFMEVQEVLTMARSRATDSGVLRRQLDSLVAVTTGYLTLADENRRLRSLLGLQERLGPGWIPASVIRSRTTGAESTFLLDVGSDQGVQRYSPVIAGQGVVGIVQHVYPTTATAMDWTHPDFRLSAMDRQGIIYGIVRSRRGEFREEDRLEFDGTAFQAQLDAGNVVVTSDLSGDWPRGVPIGKVEGLAEADAGWRKSYWLRPMVEVGSVTQVLVGVSPERDAFGAWPADSLFTDAELAQRIEAQGDSMEILRALLAAPGPVRDSVLAVLLLGRTVPGSDMPAGAPPPAGDGGVPAAPGSGAPAAVRAAPPVPATGGGGGGAAAAPATPAPAPDTAPPPAPPRPDTLSVVREAVPAPRASGVGTPIERRGSGANRVREGGAARR